MALELVNLFFEECFSPNLKCHERLQIHSAEQIVAHMRGVFLSIKSVLVDLCRDGKFHLLAKS